MGVWIEIFGFPALRVGRKVTPCMGVWIEISSGSGLVETMPSLPVWECGLKLALCHHLEYAQMGHSLYGSVD